MEQIIKYKKSELPKELQNKSTEEIKGIVETKTKEREAVQKEMADLAKKRQEFIDAESKKSKTKDDLGNAIASSIKEFAKVKGYAFEK